MKKELKRIKTIIVLSMVAMLLTVTFSISNALPPPPVTGFDYLPMNDGFWIEYEKYDVTGYFRPDMQLDVLERRYPSTECGRAPGKQCHTIRVYFSRYCTDFGSYELDRCGWFQQWIYADQSPTLINYDRGLVYGLDIIDGKTCISEVRNENNLIMNSPECILTLNPVAGETIHGLTNTYTHNPIAFSAQGGWDYKTIGFYPTWGAYGVDCVRTALDEYTGFRYNYTFCDGVGAVNIWFIGNNCVIVSGQSHCQGTEYYATDWAGR